MTDEEAYIIELEEKVKGLKEQLDTLTTRMEILSVRTERLERVIQEVRRQKAEQKAWGPGWSPSYESQNRLFAALDEFDIFYSIKPS